MPQDAITLRLKRVEGQIRGLQRLLDEGSHCEKVLTQLLAARSALDQIGLMIMSDYIDVCLMSGSEEEIKDNARIMGTCCRNCELIYVPATMFCERCFAQLDEWVEVANQGTVFTYTVLYRDLDDQPMDPPAILAYVKLEGSTGGLVH